MTSPEYTLAALHLRSRSSSGLIDISLLSRATDMNDGWAVPAAWKDRVQLRAGFTGVHGLPSVAAQMRKAVQPSERGFATRLRLSGGSLLRETRKEGGALGTPD